MPNIVGDFLVWDEFFGGVAPVEGLDNLVGREVGFAHEDLDG